MTNKFLVTGGCGFVGRHIVDTLISRGYEVRTVIRIGSSVPLPKKERIDYIESKDIFNEDEDWWRQALLDIDYFIHVAWYVNPKDYLNSDKNIDSLIGTLKIARAAVETRVKKFVGIGTCFEYKESFENLDISSPLFPATLYAATKVSAYYVLMHFFQATNTKFLWCRLFYLYGSGEKKQRLVPHIIDSIAQNRVVELTSGEEIKDYMDVHLAAKQIVDAAVGEYTGAINICSGVGVSVYDFAVSIASKWNKASLIRNVKKVKNSNLSKVVGVSTFKNKEDHE